MPSAGCPGDLEKQLKNKLPRDNHPPLRRKLDLFLFLLRSLALGLDLRVAQLQPLDLIAKCPKNDPAVAVEILAKESNKRWMREEQVVDDTTIAVAYFNITD